MDITRFRVRGLFGLQHIDIPISDNRLVIVGVNGAGKSTVLNLLYSLIARRWQKLIEYQFETIEIEINGQLLSLRRDEIATSQRSGFLLRRMIRNFVAHPREELNYRLVQSILMQPTTTDLDTRRLSQLLKIPPSEVRRLKAMIDERGDERKLDLNPNFEMVNKALQETIDAQIVFLPTYRRIEKDLKSIVPKIDEMVRTYEERYGAARRLQLSDDERNVQGFIELVEFGMEDVRFIFDRSLSALNDFSRSQLNELAGAYLGEVVRGDVDRFDTNAITNFDDQEINSILARVDERTLSFTDKQMLRDILTKLHQHPSVTSPRDRYVAHFFAKLGLVALELQKRETPIRNFVGVCNENYLVGKRIEYDRNNFTLKVLDRRGQAIQLKDLSSGEKQVVSLFSHIYLGGKSSYIILIDEPELSLSVDWQENFLPDIVKSGHCAFIAAVTHSPFIYDNEFEHHTVDLVERSSFEDPSLPL